MIRRTLKLTVILAIVFVTVPALLTVWSMNAEQRSAQAEPRSPVDDLPSGQSAEESQPSNMGVARYVCREAIERTLHDPSRADLGNYRLWPAGISETNASHILVQPTIRAPNAMGGIVQARFQCTFVILEGDNGIVFVGVTQL